MAVRIPRHIVQAARLQEGDPLSLSVRKDGAVLLTRDRPKYLLDELVSMIKPNNRHGETDWGNPVGKEIW